MKKILFLGVLFLTLGMVTSKAQSVSTYTGKIAAAEDTLTNTDTAYINFPLLSLVYDLSFKATITKVSGTVAGQIILQGSADNVQWFSLNNERGTVAAGQVADSATITNGTASYWWFVRAPFAIFPYYRLRVITSGTQVCAPTGKVYTYYKKPD